MECFKSNLILAGITILCICSIYLLYLNYIKEGHISMLETQIANLKLMFASYQQHINNKLGLNLHENQMHLSNPMKTYNNNINSDTNSNIHPEINSNMNNDPNMNDDMNSDMNTIISSFGNIPMLKIVTMNANPMFLRKDNESLPNLHSTNSVNSTLTKIEELPEDLNDMTDILNDIENKKESTTELDNLVNNLDLDDLESECKTDIEKNLHTKDIDKINIATSNTGDIKHIILDTKNETSNNSDHGESNFDISEHDIEHDDMDDGEMDLHKIKLEYNELNKLNLKQLRELMSIHKISSKKGNKNDLIDKLLNVKITVNKI